MKMMVEAVGRDVMGVCLDSGNPVWMLEDPHMTLEMLIPYAETCHVRDSAVWKVPEGIAVRWVNMGDGNVDIDGWIKKFIQAKPGLPIIFENLVSANPRIHAIYDPQFWDNWRKMPAWEFSRFLAVAEKGTPKPADAAAGGKDGRPAADRGSGNVRALHARAAAAPVMKTRVSLVGAGFIADIHAESYHRFVPEAEMVGVYSRSEERARAFAGKHGIARWSTDLDETRSRDRTATSSTSAFPTICTRDATIAAAAAGKHVIIEKPLCLTLEEADEMIAACKAHEPQADVCRGTVLRAEVRARPATGA